MQDSHAYPSYAPDPGSGRIPRPVGDRRLGALAALAGVLVAWLLARALVPDLGHTLRLAIANLDAELQLTAVEGSPDPQEVAELLRERLETADLLAEVEATDQRIRVRVGRDDEARARAWILPQGDLQLLFVSGLVDGYRDEQVKRVLKLKSEGAYDPLRDDFDVLAHPDGNGEVLLERPVVFPPHWIAEIQATRDEAGRPALDLQLTTDGFMTIKALQLHAQNRPLAAVLDGKLLSLNRTKASFFASVMLGAGTDAYEPGALERIVKLIQTRLPVRMRAEP